ncbi:MAG: amidohydrolase family protein [Armatimonadota bacterium]
MADITYFDARCYLGRYLQTVEGQPIDEPSLLSGMDHFGIHEALVLDSLSVASNPMAGNRRILERTANHPRLHPAWAGLLPHSREFPPPREFVSEMKECGVGAVYLFYRQFDLPLDDWGVDELLSAMVEERVPLFLCATDLLEPGAIDCTDWTSVVDLCRRFPELPVVATEDRIYCSQRALYEALAACPNLRIDLSVLWLHKRIEFIAREFGADRLVWGSHLPERTPGSPLMQLNYSDLSEDELRKIAGGNMRDLLSWNPNIRFVNDVDFPEPIDSLHATARERRSLREERFYDCHGHIGWADARHVINDTPEGIVREMDKLGVRVCLVFALQVLGDVGYGMDEVAEMIHRYPDRFVGLTLVNPRNGKETMLADLERGLSLGMQGVKLVSNSYGGYDVNGPLIDLCAEFAHRHRQFILNHYWGSADRLLQLCRDYPDACFIVGHSYDYFGEVFRKVDNVYLCTCPFLGWGQTERYIDIYGADRILFGSDLTDLPIAWGLGQIMYANISEADKRKILGENLLRIMCDRGLTPKGE